MLLSIDTTAGTSTAVFDGKELLSSVVFEDPFGHAENIGKAITEALAKAGLTAGDISRVLVGRGPASYTGLRVGIAAAKTLATSLGVPLHGVMVLDSLAHETRGEVLVTTDAKRRELFAATYLGGKRLTGPMLLSPEEVSKFVGHEHVQGASDAVKNGSFALATDLDLSDSSAIYLRSPDVTPSKGKRVSG